MKHYLVVFKRKKKKIAKEQRYTAKSEKHSNKNEKS